MHDSLTACWHINKDVDNFVDLTWYFTQTEANHTCLIFCRNFYHRMRIFLANFILKTIRLGPILGLLIMVWNFFFLILVDKICQVFGKDWMKDVLLFQSNFMIPLTNGNYMLPILVLMQAGRLWREIIISISSKTIAILREG